MRTIRGKMTLAMILVGLMPVLLLLGVSATRTARELKSERQSRHSSVTREISRHIRSALANAKGDLGVLSTNPRLVGDRVSEAGCQAELLRLKRDTFNSLSLLDDQGFTVVSTTNQEEVQDYSPWFKHARDVREPTLSSPFLTTGQEALQISVYIPVTDGQGSLASVIKAAISFDRITEVLQPVKIDQDEELVLLDRNGNVLFSSNGREPLTKFDDSLPLTYWGEAESDDYFDPADERFSCVREGVVLPDQIGSQREWSLVWLEHGSKIDSAVAQIYMTHAMAGLFSLALASGIGMFVSHRLTRPIGRLQAFSEQISRGNLDPDLKVGTTNELGQLADTMVTMADEIKQSRCKLEATLLAEAKNRENEVLIREIHHRVKNNLQIMGSLFRMNSRRVTGDEAKQVICESEARLHSMSLLHEVMHRTGDVSQVELGHYLRSIVDGLIQRHRQQASEMVELQLECAELSVGIDTALPCGLIVNELVSHCLEVGSTGERERARRTVKLELHACRGGMSLVVSHSDPPGDLPGIERFESSLSKSLVDMMADQLDGKVATSWSAVGFTGRLDFSENTYAERVGELVGLEA